MNKFISPLHGTKNLLFASTTLETETKNGLTSVWRETWTCSLGKNDENYLTKATKQPLKGFENFPKGI